MWRNAFIWEVKLLFLINSIWRRGGVVVSASDFRSDGRRI